MDAQQLQVIDAALPPSGMIWCAPRRMEWELAAATVAPVILQTEQARFVLAIRFRHASSNPRCRRRRIASRDDPRHSDGHPVTRQLQPGLQHSAKDRRPIRPNSLRSRRRPLPLHHALSPHIHPLPFLTAVTESDADSE